MGKTKIEWTEYSLNPFKGCSKVSSGCQHCYAEVMARRLQAMGRCGYEGVIDKNGWTGRVNFVPEVLDQLAKWKKPKRIFINSMSDTFHKKVHFKWIQELFTAMMKNNHHTYYLLTKRPENVKEMIRSANCSLVNYSIMSHIWLGVTVESQKHVGRIATLRENWNGKIFVSAEPLLSSLDLSSYIHEVDWLIVGAESGHNRRQSELFWYRGLQRQAAYLNIPFFVKQLSINGKISKNPDEWPEEFRVREIPE